MEIKTITCPNCGANTTNAQNCEYCGSLLVRFVGKGIDLSKTSYTNDSTTFPGLTAELKRNLQLQEKNPEESVTTDLLTEKANTGDAEGLSIHKSGRCCWKDGQDINLSDSNTGLTISFDFDTYIGNDDWQNQYNKRIEKRLKAFRKLDSFPLFTGHVCNATDDDGNERYCREYAIDFGNDAEGAARLTSEILMKVYGWTQDTSFDMYTEVGYDNLHKARHNWYKAHGFDEDEGETDFKTKLLFIAICSIIGWIIGKIIGFIF